MTEDEAKKELSKLIFELGFEDNIDDKVCALNMAIKALSQEPTVCDIDAIRDEIEQARFIDKNTKMCKNALASGLEAALQIIDKYKYR